MFQTSRGSRWSRASRDVVEYVERIIGIDIHTLEPSGRLVHGSRRIGLATYALACGFDTERIRDYAYLMRHDAAVSEKYYSIWIERRRSEMASADIFLAFDIESKNTVVDRDQQHNVDDSSRTYRPITLMTLSSFLRRSILTTVHASKEVSVPTSVDSGTQTIAIDILPFGSRFTTSGISDVNATNNVATDSCTIPVCAICGSRFSVMGPCGQSKHRMFGRYYLQCKICHGARPKMSVTKWFDSDYIPMAPSVSNRPRRKVEPA